MGGGMVLMVAVCQGGPGLRARLLLRGQGEFQVRAQVEEEGGGGVRQHPHGAGHDQAGPPLPGRGGQLRGGEAQPPAGHPPDQDVCQGEHQCPQGIPIQNW